MGKDGHAQVMRIATALLLSAIPMVSFAATAESWPARPVRIVTPFPAASTVDVVMRLIQPHLSERLAQPVVIDNRGGASGAIGVEVVQRATPDGYTMLLGTASTHSLAKALNSKLSYDPQRDFAPVTLIGNVPYAMAVYPGLPAKNLQEVVQLARAKPGEIRYTSVGNASLAHLAGELLSMLANVKMTHVPYKSSAASVIDVIAGRVELWIGSTAPALPHIRAGRVRALATTGATRLPALPDVPTVKELGFPSYEVALWMAIFAPAGTPKPVIDRANRELVAVLKKPDLHEGLIAQGVTPQPSTPAELATHITAEIAKWSRVIKTAGIKTD
jgi:tripartite-type tricarboxylate transporter receptor subunit TctC